MFTFSTIHLNLKATEKLNHKSPNILKIEKNKLQMKQN